MATYPKVRCIQDQLTAAQVNAASGAGTVIVAAGSGRTLEVVDCWMRALGGNAGGATAVILTDTAASPTTLVSYAVGALTENTVARAGAASVTSTNLGASAVKHKGLRIGRTVSDLTTATALDYCVFYTVSS